MSELHRIPAGSVRAIWLFVLELPEAEIKAFTEESYGDDDTVAWPLRDALGVPHLDHDFIEVFKAETLKDFGLARYLTEANGMDEATVTPDAETLDTLSGTLVLLSSVALPDGLDRIEPRAPLRLVGRYSEQPDMRLRPPLRSDSAGPQSAETPPAKKTSDAAMSGRIATLALLVLGALVGLMIWVGG